MALINQEFDNNIDKYLPYGFEITRHELVINIQGPYYYFKGTDTKIQTEYTYSPSVRNITHQPQQINYTTRKNIIFISGIVISARPVTRAVVSSSIDPYSNNWIRQEYEYANPQYPKNLMKFVKEQIEKWATYNKIEAIKTCE